MDTSDVIDMDLYLLLLSLTTAARAAYMPPGLPLHIMSDNVYYVYFYMCLEKQRLKRTPLPQMNKKRWQIRKQPD
jgi:hypothetical protein